MQIKNLARETVLILGNYALLWILLSAAVWYFCPPPLLKWIAPLVVLIVGGLSAYFIYPALPIFVTIYGLNRRLLIAEKFAQFSLNLHEVLSPGSLETGFHLALFAEVLRGQARFAEAEATVRQAIDLYNSDQNFNKRAKYHRIEAEGLSYELLGSVLRDQGKYSEALKAGKKGCEILEQRKIEVSAATTADQLEVVNRALASSYYELARTLNITGQPDDAMTLLHLALDLRGEETPPDRCKASVLAELSKAYLMSGEFKEAECAAAKAQTNLSHSEQPEEQLARARVNLVIADVLRQCPEKTAEERAAITPLRAEALRIRKKWLAAKDPELLDIGGG